MSRFPIQQVTTFASDPFAGNPAWVVTLEGPRPTRLLQRLCRHLDEPMIAVLAPEDDSIGLGFVTPEGTHPGAGHATHAAAWVAFQRLRPAATTIDFRLDDGGLRTARRDGELISVDWPVMAYTGTDRVAELSACLRHAPKETFSAPFGLVAVLDDEDDVAGLGPDLGSLSRLPEDVVIVTAPARSADFAIRVFAPKVGLPEDPVCGTAHRILTPLWAQRIGRDTLTSHQLSPRGGELICRLDGETVAISGRAVTVIEGTWAAQD